MQIVLIAWVEDPNPDYEITTLESGAYLVESEFATSCVNEIDSHLNVYVIPYDVLQQYKVVR